MDTIVCDFNNKLFVVAINSLCPREKVHKLKQCFRSSIVLEAIGCTMANLENASEEKLFVSI